MPRGKVVCELVIIVDCVDDNMFWVIIILSLLLRLLMPPLPPLKRESDGLMLFDRFNLLLMSYKSKCSTHTSSTSSLHYSVSRMNIRVHAMAMARELYLRNFVVR